MPQMNLDDIDKKFWERIATEKKLHQTFQNKNSIWLKIFLYVVRVGDALSQLLNVAFFLGSNPNESLSGRSYANKEKSYFWFIMFNVINFLFFFQDNHCKLAYTADLERARLMLDNN